MDWSAVIPLVAKAAPTIGQLLGGFIPFPGGALLGQMAGQVLASALGVPPDPTSVANAIQTGDPAKVNAALSEAEAKIAAQVEMHKADLEDVANARQTQLALIQAGSAVGWGAVVLSILIVSGFLGCMCLLMLAKINFTDTSGQAFLILTGILAQAFAQVVGYWLGSSAGSSDKSNQIAALAASAVGTKVAVPVKKR